MKAGHADDLITIIDMNRDWLPVQLPESQACIKTFRKWMPNVLCDFHENGTTIRPTYFSAW
jgi:hypothetical protein